MVLKWTYQAVVSLVWAAGLYFLISLAGLFAGLPDLTTRPFVPLILIGLGIASAMTFYSYWLGAQPGHLIRAVNVALVSLLIFVMYRDYRDNPDADLVQSSLVWVIAIGVTLLNVSVGRQLREMYREQGRVDYFKIYFGR